MCEFEFANKDHYCCFNRNCMECDGGYDLDYSLIESYRENVCSECSTCNSCLHFYFFFKYNKGTCYGLSMRQVYYRYNTCANCSHDFDESQLGDECCKFICSNCGMCRSCSISRCSPEKKESVIKPALFFETSIRAGWITTCLQLGLMED